VPLASKSAHPDREETSDVEAAWGAASAPDPAAAGAQVTSGTSPAGLFYETSGSGAPVVLIHAFSGT
jgi:hypothetical protein